MRNRVFTAARDAVLADDEADESVFPLRRAAYSWANYLTALLFVSPLIIAVFIDDLIHISLSQAISGLMFICIGSFLVAFPYSIWKAPKYSLRVSEKGITGYSIWNRKIVLSWGEIETVESVCIFAYPCLKIKSFRKDRAPIWLPLFLRSPEGFRAAVAYHASPNNPLRRYLEEEQDPERKRLAT